MRCALDSGRVVFSPRFRRPATARRASDVNSCPDSRSERGKRRVERADAVENNFLAQEDLVSLPPPVGSRWRLEKRASPASDRYFLSQILPPPFFFYRFVAAVCRWRAVPVDGTVSGEVFFVEERRLDYYRCSGNSGILGTLAL